MFSTIANIYYYNDDWLYVDTTFGNTPPMSPLILILHKQAYNILLSSSLCLCSIYFIHWKGVSVHTSVNST